MYIFTQKVDFVLKSPREEELLQQERKKQKTSVNINFGQISYPLRLKVPKNIFINALGKLHKDC